METEPNTATITSAIKKKVFMLPAISEHTADLIYFIGNILLVITAVTAALGAIGVFWGDRVRDYYNDLRLSDNEKQIEVAKAEAAKANSSAANANKAVADAQKETAHVNVRATSLEKDVAEANARSAADSLELERIKLRCTVPESHGANFSREWESALWQKPFTAAPARRRAFEPSSKRRKKVPAPWPPATG